MRTILFYGNCYAATLEAVFSASLAPLTGDVASYQSCYDEDDGTPARIAQADIIVQQIFDVDQKVSLDAVADHVEIVRFPTVSLGFLWPYGLVPHVRNFAPDYWQCGPYDYLLGDNFLNRRIEQGVAPDDAVEEYLSLDIAHAAHVDRLREIMIDRQRARDIACDMHFADEIEARFRSEYLFLNPYRPNARMAARLAHAVFARLGVETATIERITARWRKTPFERTALPIHPGIARHFDLTYGHGDQRYLYHTGEMLTFEQFVRRYAAFRWNDPLLRGAATLHWAGSAVYREFRQPVSAERIDTALADLEAGLAASDGSALGERAVAALVLKRGDRDRALAALAHAVAFDPDDAEAHFDHGALLEDLNRTDEAEAAFRRAITADPAFDPAYHRLGLLLGRAGRVDEAIAALEPAVELRPGQAFYLYDLAMLHAAVGRRSDAKLGLARSIEAMPSPAAMLSLAELYLADDEIEDAERMLRAASDAGAGDAVATLRERMAGQRSTETVLDFSERRG